MAKRPVTPTQDPDAVEAARLRAAHQRLDERPSPGVRAAVLRAAADSASGKPVGQTVTVLQRRPARSWFGWRPAAAAGVTVAVGILAVGVAIHVEHEPTMESRPEAPAAAVSAPPAAPAPAPFPAHPPAAAPASDKAERSSAAAVARQTPPIEAPAPAAAPAGQTPPVQVTAPAAAPAGQMPPVEAPAPAAAPVEKARYRVAPPQLQAGAQRSSQTASPQQWLRRIIELRHTGRNAEADDELARFRAAFPNVKVPDDALR